MTDMPDILMTFSWKVDDMCNGLNVADMSQNYNRYLEDITYIYDIMTSQPSFPHISVLETPIFDNT